MASGLFRAGMFASWQQHNPARLMVLSAAGLPALQDGADTTAQSITARHHPAPAKQSVRRSFPALLHATCLLRPCTGAAPFYRDPCRTTLAPSVRLLRSYGPLASEPRPVACARHAAGHRRARHHRLVHRRRDGSSRELRLPRPCPRTSRRCARHPRAAGVDCARPVKASGQAGIMAPCPHWSVCTKPLASESVHSLSVVGRPLSCSR